MTDDIMDATGFSIQLAEGKPVSLNMNGKEYTITERSEEAMTNTMRDRFDRWYNRRFANRDCDGCIHGAEDMLESYQAAHADMLPVLERVRDGLKHADKCEHRYDAMLHIRKALTELEAIMKGKDHASNK